eukprot:maker-scaffold_67-snap-gene-0.2-mRNA-1 protein AED:0.08 eAED:0.08 QI:157/1/1/1/0.5/0.33/3/268/322
MYKRLFSTIPSLPKTTVIGAAGGIGQPLSLLLKSAYPTNLALYDLVNTPGVAADISHISSPGSVNGYIGQDQLLESLQDADAVVIPAGVPRKPGMTRDDLFNTNASIVQSLAEACAKSCPDALVFIISNPVNSTVPIFAETLKKHGAYNPKKLFGVTTLDVVRARTFVGEANTTDPSKEEIEVIGGHAGTTILPLIDGKVEGGKYEGLVNRIQFGGDEVVKAKDGTGSATLSMAFAAAEFVGKVMSGEVVEECAFVDQVLCEDEEWKKKVDCDFFATKLKIGRSGVEEIVVPKLSAEEEKLFDSMIGDLRAQVKKGQDFVNN